MTPNPNENQGICQICNRHYGFCMHGTIEPNENQAEKHSAEPWKTACCSQCGHDTTEDGCANCLKVELEAAKKGENLEEVAKAIKECLNCNWRSNHFCGWHGVSVHKLLFQNS